MPIYEYKCPFCGDVKEKFYPSIPKKVPERVLFHCCKMTMNSHDRILSKPNFQLKGTCWAKDGYSMQHVDGSRITSVTEPED